MTNVYRISLFAAVLLIFENSCRSESGLTKQFTEDAQEDTPEGRNSTASDAQYFSETTESGRGEKYMSAGSKGNKKYYTRSTTVPPPSNVTIDLGRFSEKFLSCQHWKIEKDYYEMLANGSVHIEKYSTVLDDSDYYIDTNRSLFVCSDVFVEADTYSALDIMSAVGLIVSMVCIVLHIIMFALVPSLQNLPGYCLVSLCVALLSAYLSFILRTRFQWQDCTGIGISVMYFFLTAFFWMNALSYDVWRSLRLATSKLRLITHMWLRFGCYSLYSWGCPVLIVITAVIVDKTGDVPEEYKLIFDPTTCWIAYKPALLVYFAVPMSVLLFCNIMFFAWSFFMISSAAMKNAENKGVLAMRFCIFLRLFVIMGLTWIFGTLGAATGSIVFWYLFVLANCFQGLLIFFSFSFGKKTRTAWKKLVNKRKTSACPTLSSFRSQNTSSV